MTHNITMITDYIHSVLVGDVPNTDKSFFAIDGDLIIRDSDDRITLLMDDGKKYQVRIMEDN